MNEMFQELIQAILSIQEKQHRNKFNSAGSILKRNNNITGNRLNDAFLVCLCGKTHPCYMDALGFLNKMREDKTWKDYAKFYSDAIKRITDEIKSVLENSPVSRKNLRIAHDHFKGPSNTAWNKISQAHLWSFFFPEGAKKASADEYIKVVRKKRAIKIIKPNPEPILSPALEILFTSNILITLPSGGKGIRLPSDLKKKVDKISRRPQDYYYDHPVPIDTDFIEHEAIHGLKELDNSIEFEKRSGGIPENQRITVVLSLSATHKGLDIASASYIRMLLSQNLKLANINLYLFTEQDTERLIKKVLFPASGMMVNPDQIKSISDVFGVSGEYGRHYSFLKAIAAFWQVVADHKIKAVFKIDLDQVFPQDKLIKITHKSAFEHLMNPLWGGFAIDNLGHRIDLGMMAGSLVDKKDIDKSPFTPDAEIPLKIPSGPAMVFFSQYLRAISTHAEMHGNNRRTTQRFHILGGMNGIMVKSLFKYRPFTPTFINRAEDQAYLMSVLYKGRGAWLRCVNIDGFIMRHDKDVIAGKASNDSEAGREVSDLLRIIQFTQYAKALPFNVKSIKELLDPFTGCFITPIPWTLMLLKFSLQISESFGSGNKKGFEKALLYQSIGVKRLSAVMHDSRFKEGRIRSTYLLEKKAWDRYYDMLGQIEKRISSGDRLSMTLKEKAVKIISHCRVNNDA